MRRSYKTSYKECEIIGQGKFANVLLIENLETHLFCIAKKILIANLAPKEQDASLQELSILKNLIHPNIVTYHESFLEDDFLVIIMEYCEEGDLHYHIQQQLSQKTHFPEKTILNWFLQMVMALEYIHRSQILHRDIKSSNIFLTACGSIKIGDFGIAKILTTTIPTTNTLVGTPNYLSPEICDNKPYTYKTDIWALGCVLYELCALKVPFQAQNIMELLVKITKDNIEPIPKIYSKDIGRLLKGLLTKEANKRPSCQEILAKPMFIKVMQEFIMKEGRDLIQKKVPIKQYSIHNQMKAKSPQKIIHKKPLDSKGGHNKSKEKNLGIKKGSTKENQIASDRIRGLKINNPISPIKGISCSKPKTKLQAKTQPKTIQNKNKANYKTKSLSTKPENDQKSLKKENNKSLEVLKVAGMVIKKGPEPINLTNPTYKFNSNDDIKVTDEKDPIINSLLMNTEISFNISLTQDSVFYRADSPKKDQMEYFIPKTDELIKVEDTRSEQHNDDIIFEGIETREDDESSLEEQEEYKDDFEDEDDTENLEKLGRLTLPRTKETLNDLMEVYKSQLVESQKIAKTLYEGNLKVIEEELSELSSQEMSKKKEEFKINFGL